MHKYGQFCPLAQSVQLLCERWTLLVVRELIAGSTRFNELQKGVPLMSPSLLSSRLKQLAAAGVVKIEGKRGNYTYTLTQAGQELRPVIEVLGAWGHRWVRSSLDKVDLDAGLLMWDIRRSIDPDIFPSRRVVVEFNYPDAPKGAQQWWLVSENGEIDLCLNDPGYDVDIVLTSSLQSMTRVWICEELFDEAVKAQRIKVAGDPALIKCLQAWLRTSPLSKLGTVSEMPTLRWQFDH